MPDFGCCHGLQALAERRRLLTRTDSLAYETPLAARKWGGGPDRSTNDACDFVMFSQSSTEDASDCISVRESLLVAEPVSGGTSVRKGLVVAQPVSDGISAREGLAVAEQVAGHVPASGDPTKECEVHVGDLVLWKDGQQGIVEKVLLFDGDWIVQSMIKEDLMHAGKIIEIDSWLPAGSFSDLEKKVREEEEGTSALQEASASADRKTGKAHAKEKAKAKAKTAPKAKSKAGEKASPKAKSKAKAKTSPKAKSKAKAKASPKATSKAEKTSPATARGECTRHAETPANNETKGEDKAKAEAYERRKAYCRERRKIITLSNAAELNTGGLTERQEFFRDSILHQPCVESLCCHELSSWEPLPTLAGPIQVGEGRRV